jgi:thymidylate synthase
MKSLFQPKKYKVFEGGGKSFGLCTVWNEAELIFHNSKILREKIAILGTLYSRSGINIIFRNLALNPRIKKLFVWGNGGLSNTQFGVMGKSLLEDIWKNGVEDDGSIKGTKFKLEKEIDVGILRKILNNVELINISDLSLREVEEYFKKINDTNEVYMEPTEFPETTLEKTETSPSEEVGWLTRGDSILEVWLRVVEKIMRYGSIKGTQYGYQQRELIGVTWVISNEDPDNPNLSLSAEWPEELRKVTGAIEKDIKEYYSVFLSPETPVGISYTYGNRLMSYPLNDGKLDQIEDVIIKQLKDSPDSRRAVATTLIPEIDAFSKEPPCITQLQALQSNGRLHFLVTVRSHDIFKAAIPNAFGLRTLQKKVSKKLGFEPGQLQISSQSAHIYEQDWDNAYKLVRCAFWERDPSLVFNPSLQRDPRGYMVISIDKKINATLHNFQGGILINMEGSTAKEIIGRIAQLDLLSRPDHLLDIGAELQKAEIALKEGLDYHQDKSINI